MAKYNKALSHANGVRLYGPTTTKPYFRVWSVEGEYYSERLTPENEPEQREWADGKFIEVVEWMSRTGGPATKSAAPTPKQTIADLCLLREKDLETKVAAGTIQYRTYEAASDAHRVIKQALGTTLIRDWSVEQSAGFISELRVRYSRHTVQRMGANLRALVTFAHAGEHPLLPFSRDPMRGVDYSLRPVAHGESELFVPRRLRPTTAQIEALMAAIDARCVETMGYMASRPRCPVVLDRSYGGLVSATPAFTGLRSEETFALTVRSVLGHDRGDLELWVHEAAIQPAHTTRRWYGPVKDKRQRYVVVPRYWSAIKARAEALLARFGPELGMSALLFPQNDHNFVWVEHTKATEDRIYGRNRANGQPGIGHWQDQDLWERAAFRRSIFLPAAKKAGWPGELDWGTHRHHFATWADDSLHWPIEDISRQMGHADVSITHRVYFLSSERANQRLIAALPAQAG